MTFGTVTFCGPDETVIVTVEPLAAWVPAGGSVLITLPLGTLSDGWLWLRVLNPAWPSWLAATSASWPVTSGTATFSGPLDTMRVTVAPLAALVLAAGSWLITRLGATLSSALLVMRTVKPAPSRASVAETWSLPTTFGTVTCGAPALTVMCTVDPFFTLVPGSGDWAATFPVSTVSLGWETFSTTRPASVIMRVASASESPMTVGTATLAPLDPTPSERASRKSTAPSRASRIRSSVMYAPVRRRGGSSAMTAAGATL